MYILTASFENKFNHDVAGSSGYLVSTQYIENYGEESSPHWKYKGGELYFVECANASAAQLAKLYEHFTGSEAINNAYAKEVVMSIEFHDEIPQEYF